MLTILFQPALENSEKEPRSTSRGFEDASDLPLESASTQPRQISPRAPWRVSAKH